MILFSPGIKRRAVAGVCAVLLVLTLVAYPVRARAASTALAAVGVGVTVAAFLMACGVYPYAEGESFAEWAAQDLEALWQQFTQAHATQVTYSSIKAFVLGGVLCYPRVTWDALRDFVAWIRDTFSLADDMADVAIGEYSGAISLPVMLGPSYSALSSGGYYAGYQLSGGQPYYGDLHMAASRDGVYLAYVPRLAAGGSNYLVYAISLNPFTDYTSYSSRSNYVSSHYSANYGLTYNGAVVHSYEHEEMRVNQAPSDALIVAAVRDAFPIVFGGASEFSGIMADTGALSVPAALPEGAEFGGLQVAELGATATPQALEDAIEAGVMERQQPVVRPLEVEIEAGIEVNTDTGAVTQNPAIITSDSVALSPSDFTLPRAISTVFPFSVPWDILRVYQALDAEPAFPEIHAYLYVPGSSLINSDYVDDKIPFTIGIPEDMRPGFDAFAVKFRSIVLLLACIAVTWAMVKFFRF